MRTKQQIADVLYRQKRSKALSTIDFTTISITFNALTAEQQEAIAKELMRGDGKRAGVLLHGYVVNDVILTVKAQVDLALANDSLDLLELDNIV